MPRLNEKKINLTGLLPFFNGEEVVPFSAFQDFWENRLPMGEHLYAGISIKKPDDMIDIAGNLNLSYIEYELNSSHTLGLKTEEGFYLLLSYNRRINVDVLEVVGKDKYKDFLNIIDGDLFDIRRKESFIFSNLYILLEPEKNIVTDGTRVVLDKGKEGLTLFLLERYNISIIEEGDKYIIDFLFNGLRSYDDYMEPDRLALVISSYFQERHILGL